MSNTSVNKPAWAVQFKIDDKTWENLCIQSREEHVTPLDLALDRGLLNENILIQWDRDLSGMASLKAVFFNGEPPKDLWASLDYFQCRAAACMPIAEWDGVVYWAKLSSMPTGLEEQNPAAVWVLAPWSGMKKWFTVWNSLARQQDTPAPRSGDIVDDAPVGLSLSDGPKEETPAADPLPEIPPADFGAPAGLSNTSTAINVDFTSIGVDHESGEMEAVTPAPENSMPPAPPEEMPAPPMVNSTEAPDSDNGLALEMDLSDITSTPPPPPTEASSTSGATPDGDFSFDVESDSGITMDNGETETPPPVPVQGPPAVPRATPPPLPVMDQPKMGQGKMTPPPVPPLAAVPPNAAVPPPLPNMSAPPPPPPPMRPSAVSPTAPPPPPMGASSNDDFNDRLSRASNQDALAKIFMDEWQKTFEKVMILLFQKDRLVVWWQSGSWQVPTARGTEIQLDTPSIFKIVADTNRPYHGYVSPGPVNDQFFMKTNRGEYPSHVTIVPIVTDERVMAMVFGACSKEAGQQLVLAKLEDAARGFSTALIRVINPEKKAS